MNIEIVKSFNILKSVYIDKAYANIELNKVLREKSDINYALITKIVYGVLEKDIYLDYVINTFIKPSTKEQIVILFKLGRYLKEEINSIPDYTIVNELVEISKHYGDKFVSGFVNATLKNIINAKVTLPKQGTSKYLSVKYSYPEWIVKELLKTKTYDFVESILSYELTTLTHIRILKDVDYFVKALKVHNITYKDTPLNNTKYVDYSELIKNEKTFGGRYVVQGLPSLICALSLEVKPNSNVLDATAAPGGKTAVIAGISDSINVTACDLHSHRVMLIENYMKKLGINNVKALRQDATMPNKDFENKFDYVLLDVPCSGIGVVNKKPDILLNRTPSDLDNIVLTQFKILENNCKYVKNNGVLVYSTCSILDRENGEIIDRFLASHKEFKLTEINTRGVNAENNNLKYTFYPHVSDTEGFFIARMVKNENIT